MAKKSFLLIYCLFSFSVFSQNWKKTNFQFNASFRGITALNEKIIWACGSNGTVIKTADGGTTWQKTNFPVDSLDLRDIYIFNENSVLVMSAGEASKNRAKLFQTFDGGENWILTYENKTNGVFFDSFDFWNEKTGILVGDPIDNKAFILQTTDGGYFWKQLGPLSSPVLDSLDATFASSGTSIVTLEGGFAWFCTQNKIFLSKDYGNNWTVSSTPFEKSDSKGIFGIHFSDKNKGIIVGGNYREIDESGVNISFTNDGGKSWITKIPTKLYGLKESVYRINSKKIISVGASGTAISDDAGVNWNMLDSENFHALTCKGKKCWAVGKDGNVGIIEF